MKQLQAAVVALVTLSSPAIAGAQEQYPSLAAFLRSTLKGQDRVSVQARGDLNGDGLQDWAGVVDRRASNASTDQLFVLVRLRGGGYRVAGKSREEDIGGTGCCWVEDVRIHGATLYVQSNGKTAGTMQATTHRFRWLNGDWRLTGVNVYETEVGADRVAETDMDLLTGAVVEKRGVGNGRPTINRRRREQFPARRLGEFDFSSTFGTEARSAASPRSSGRPPASPPAAAPTRSVHRTLSGRGTSR